MFDYRRLPGGDRGVKGRCVPAVLRGSVWHGMSKRYQERVEVTAVADEDEDSLRPAAFRWRGSVYRVLAVLGHWREDAGYWSGGGVEVPQRDLWRVEASNSTRSQGVYELVWEAGTWRLDRVWD